VAPARLARRRLNRRETELERLLKARAGHDLWRLAGAPARPHHPPTPSRASIRGISRTPARVVPNHTKEERMKRTALALLAALAAAPAAHAGDLSYTWLEAGYLRADPDGLDAENGFGLRGSGAITENLHVFGGFDRYSVDVLDDDLDIDQFRLGLGWNTAITDHTDFVARVAYERIDADIIDDNGWSVEAGVRSAFSPNFEGSAALRYTDIADDDTTQLVLGGQYKFNATWGIAAEVALGNDGNALFIGPRASF
jgi:Ax21 family sulfation-dependent quorum factor